MSGENIRSLGMTGLAFLAGLFADIAVVLALPKHQPHRFWIGMSVYWAVYFFCMFIWTATGRKGGQG